MLRKRKGGGFSPNFLVGIQDYTELKFRVCWSRIKFLHTRKQQPISECVVNVNGGDRDNTPQQNASFSPGPHFNLHQFYALENVPANWLRSTDAQINHKGLLVTYVFISRTKPPYANHVLLPYGDFSPSHFKSQPGDSL